MDYLENSALHHTILLNKYLKQNKDIFFETKFSAQSRPASDRKKTFF